MKNERAVGAVDEVVGRVQAPALVAVGHHGDVAVRLDAQDAAVAVLAHDQAPVGVEGQAVGAGLVIAPDVGARVAALGAEHGHLAARVPAVDRVGVGRGEQQRAFGAPHRALGELEAAGHLLDARAVTGDLVEAGREALELEGRGTTHVRALARVEVERRGAHPDVVVRRGGDRAVDAEHGDLEAVARPRVAREHDAVGRVEAADDLAAGVAERDRQRAVDPHLGVVVDGDLEDDGGAGRVEVADALGDRDAGAVPVEAHAALREPALRVGGREGLPARVVVVQALRVRHDVVGAVGNIAGAERVGAHPAPPTSTKSISCTWASA